MKNNDKFFNKMVKKYNTMLIEIIDKIEETFKQNLPHGNGIDGDWHIITDLEKKKVYCYNYFHCMNNTGYYGGRAHFVIIFDGYEGDFKLHFRGKKSQYLNKKYLLREFLEETFINWKQTSDII